MKKNGFTLAELLAVLAILSVLVLLAIPSLLKILYQAKNLLNENDKAVLIDASKTFLEDYDLCNKKYVYQGTNPVTINDHQYNAGDEMSCYDFKLYAMDGIEFSIKELVNTGFFNDGCDYDDTNCGTNSSCLIDNCKIDEQCMITGIVKTEMTDNKKYYITSGYDISLGDKCIVAKYKNGTKKED